MNYHLDALYEQISLLSPFSIPEAAPKVAHSQDKIAAIGRAATQHGFRFHKMDGWRPAYLGDRLPKAMALVDACASQTPGFGATSQRLLSSVAHAKLHGLSRFLMHELLGPGGSDLDGGVRVTRPPERCRHLAIIRRYGELISPRTDWRMPAACHVCRNASSAVSRTASMSLTKAENTWSIGPS